MGISPDRKIGLGNREYSNKYFEQQNSRVQYENLQTFLDGVFEFHFN